MHNPKNNNKKLGGGMEECLKVLCQPPRPRISLIKMECKEILLRVLTEIFTDLWHDNSYLNWFVGCLRPLPRPWWLQHDNKDQGAVERAQNIKRIQLHSAPGAVMVKRTRYSRLKRENSEWSTQKCQRRTIPVSH